MDLFNLAGAIGGDLSPKGILQSLISEANARKDKSGSYDELVDSALSKLNFGIYGNEMPERECLLEALHTYERKYGKEKTEEILRTYEKVSFRDLKDIWGWELTSGKGYIPGSWQSSFSSTITAYFNDVSFSKEYSFKFSDCD